MSKEEVALWVLSHGGSVSPVSCYDEEGVEGWLWEWDDREFTELGDWNDVPAIPDEMIEHFNTKYPEGV